MTNDNKDEFDEISETLADDLILYGNAWTLTTVDPETKLPVTVRVDPATIQIKVNKSKTKECWACDMGLTPFLHDRIMYHELPEPAGMMKCHKDYS